MLRRVSCANHACKNLCIDVESRGRWPTERGLLRVQGTGTAKRDGDLTPRHTCADDIPRARRNIRIASLGVCRVVFHRVLEGVSPETVALGVV